MTAWRRHERAVALGAYSYRSVQSILKRNLDQAKAEVPVDAVTVEHENARGAARLRKWSAGSGSAGRNGPDRVVDKDRIQWTDQWSNRPDYGR